MFAYNFLYVVRRQDDLSDIFERTVRGEHGEVLIPSASVEQRELFPSAGNYRDPLVPNLRRR
jgi:hypothetical protein